MKWRQRHQKWGKKAIKASPFPSRHVEEAAFAEAFLCHARFGGCSTDGNDRLFQKSHSRSLLGAFCFSATSQTPGLSTHPNSLLGLLVYWTTKSWGLFFSFERVTCHDMEIKWISVKLPNLLCDFLHANRWPPWDLWVPVSPICIVCIQLNLLVPLPLPPCLSFPPTLSPSSSFYSSLPPSLSLMLWILPMTESSLTPHLSCLLCLCSIVKTVSPIRTLRDDSLNSSTLNDKYLQIETWKLTEILASQIQTDHTTILRWFSLRKK